ncbi:MAG: DUF1573 domain-containing protein [Phycisphaerales bacterium]|nr:DUF1573 domain-containing protein [Phycisphaerales bacterium]
MPQTRSYRFILAAALAATVFIGLPRSASGQEMSQDQQVQEDGPGRLGERGKRDFGHFQGPVPPLEVLDDGLSLGDIEPGSEHIRTVKLCNRGLKPLIIERTTADCACTAMEPETREIPAGGCIDFTVRYKANQNVAPFHKQVRIFCEGFPNPFLAHVTGEVTYAVKMNKNGLRGIQQRSGMITLDSIDGAPFSVLAMNGEAPVFVSFDPEVDEPRSSYVVKYNWSAIPAEKLSRWMIIETDHPDAPMMDLRVIIPELLNEREPLINPQHKLRPIEDRVLIPDLRVGESREISVTIKGVGRGTADAVAFKTRDGRLDVQLVDHDDQPRSGTMVYRLNVTPRADASGFEHSVLEVTLGDETSGLDLFARVIGSSAVSSN